MHSLREMVQSQKAPWKLNGQKESTSSEVGLLAGTSTSQFLSFSDMPRCVTQIVVVTDLCTVLECETSISLNVSFTVQTAKMLPKSTAVASLCKNCFGHKECCPYIGMSLLRGTTAVRW